MPWVILAANLQRVKETPRERSGSPRTFVHAALSTRASEPVTTLDPGARVARFPRFRDEPAP